MPASFGTALICAVVILLFAGLLLALLVSTPKTDYATNTGCLGLVREEIRKIKKKFTGTKEISDLEAWETLSLDREKKRVPKRVSWAVIGRSTGS